MLGILMVMSAGMVFGFLFRKQQGFFKYIDKIVMVTIFLLLFFLGISVGLNEKVVNSFHLIGFQAFLLTSGALAGSILLSYAVYLFFFRRRKYEK